MTLITHREHKAAHRPKTAGKPRWTELDEKALAALSTPSEHRTIPVTLDWLGGMTVYVADTETAQDLRDNDAILA